MEEFFKNLKKKSSIFFNGKTLYKKKKREYFERSIIITGQIIQSKRSDKQ